MTTDQPRTGDTITTAEEYEAVRVWFFERGEYLIVREAWRPWVITEDDRGDAWAWSWREDDAAEGERPGGDVVAAESLRLPLTILYVPAVPSDHTATTEDVATAIRTEVEYRLRTVAAYFRMKGKHGEEPRPDFLPIEIDAATARLTGLLATARPDTTTEWGVRPDGAAYTYRYEDEDSARDIAAAQGRTVVRREVTAWTEAGQ